MYLSFLESSDPSSVDFLFIISLEFEWSESADNNNMSLSSGCERSTSASVSASSSLFVEWFFVNFWARLTRDDGGGGDGDDSVSFLGFVRMHTAFSLNTFVLVRWLGDDVATWFSFGRQKVWRGSDKICGDNGIFVN